MMAPVTETVSPEQLAQRYDAFLLDAYGVLNDGQGPLAIGTRLLQAIGNKPFAVVTNDASRLPATLSARFASMGYQIPDTRIVTSGDMLVAHLRTATVKTVLVLGSKDSHAFVRMGGAISVEPAPGVDADALAICDDDGFDFRRAIEWSLSAVCRAIEAGRSFELILANPDLMYPKSAGEIGITAGAMAGLMDLVLRERFGDRAPRFRQLGKPEPAMLHEAMKRLGVDSATQRVVMVGDQVSKDVAAAYAAGVDSALVGQAHELATWQLQ
jgi:HAD superfamily hydrolase (TIGR01450 family)